MVRRYYKSVFDELDDVRKNMEALSREMDGTNPMVLLPGPALLTTKMLPEQRDIVHVLRVDVTTTEEEVVVTAGIMQGVLKKNIALSLVDPVTLKISCELETERGEENAGYFLWEKRFGSMTRIVPLPRPVTEEGSRATFGNGVLEVHLKKSGMEKKGKIPVD